MIISFRSSDAAALRGEAPARRRGTLLIPVVVLLIVPIGIGFLLLRPPQPFHPSFAGPDRLVTNERAYHRPDMPGIRRSADWWVTSGSLFARDGAGWTGTPDEVLPDAGSRNGTGSAIFRVVSARDDFQDVTVRLRLRVESLTEVAGTHAYDGAHLFLRYQGPDELYGVTMFRRDGLVVVKRKLPGNGGRGEYVTLAAATKVQPLNRWIDVVVRVVTLDSGSVRITLWVDGGRVLVATDRGRRGDAIKDSGRVGLRGDNCQFSFTGFRADPMT
ncbi:MAG TPA: hypothetical protein VFZ32_05275 [Micromonosporaceae bacterium]